MAKTWYTGDSIAMGQGKEQPGFYTKGNTLYDNTTRQPVARVHQPVGPEMLGFIERTLSQAQYGDTVIVSAGYNGGLSAHKDALIETLRQAPEGVNVVIGGVRDQFPGNRRYSKYYGEKEGEALNAMLRDVATQSGAIFNEAAREFANTKIPGTEIHPENHYAELRRINQRAAEDVGIELPQHETITEVAVAQPSSPPGDLFAGKSKDEIEHYQRFARDMGYPAGKHGKGRDGVDGKGGAATRQAMQQVVALSGQTPANNAALLDQFQSVQRQYAALQGLSKEEAISLQASYKQAGLDIGTSGPARDGVDGDPGMKTFAATLQAQQQGLALNNPVWAKLGGATPPTEVATLGQEAQAALAEAAAQAPESLADLSVDQVKHIQAYCRDLGATPGKGGPNKDGVDGAWGKDSAAAVQEVVSWSGQTPAEGDALLQQFRTVQTQLGGIEPIARDKVDTMALQSTLGKLGHPAGAWGPNKDGVDGNMGKDTVQSLYAVAKDVQLDMNRPLLPQVESAKQQQQHTEEQRAEVGQLTSQNFHAPTTDTSRQRV